jgi:hypothetical protein
MHCLCVDGEIKTLAKKYLFISWATFWATFSQTHPVTLAAAG